jgi:F-type H+-transporting ATPase subunit b
MQIDWITVAAQIVNFLILVWLLHRFLYGPIIKAMDDREAKIAARLRDAAEQKTNAEREANDYRAQREALEADKERILARAEEQAKSTQRSLEDAARSEVEKRRSEWLRQIEDEKEQFIRDMRRRSSGHVLALARQALSELADEDLAEKMAASFARQIEAVDPSLRERLAKACRQAGNRAVIVSSVEFGAEAQRRITRAVHKGIADTAEVHYQQSGDVANGVELKVGSLTLAWSFATFLDELEQRLSKDLSRMRAPEPEPPPT